MKRVRLLCYVFALTLIFVGAAGATKASAVAQAMVRWNEAENEEYTVAMKQQFTDSDDTSNYLKWQEVSNGYTIREANNVEVTVTPAQGYTVTVTAKDGGGGALELTRNGNKYSFTMIDKSVEITIEATATQNGGEGGNSGDGGEGEESNGSLAATVAYAQEYIEVTSDKQVYFQIIKTNDKNTKVKEANWIKAALKEEGKYAIDYSATANSKDIFYALTSNPLATKPDTVVTVDAVIKSAKITLNYKAEKINTTDGKGLYEIIGELTLKMVDKSADYVWDGKEDLSTRYGLSWKRGANGTWTPAAEFDQFNWDMVKASNSILYISVCSQKGTDGMVGFRLSKEIKLKIPKAAKAPTVKVDYVKGTLGLKNGMQVRVNDNETWLDIVAYDKTETTKTAVFALAESNEVTGTKVSTVAVADLVAAIRDEKLLNMTVEDGKEIKLEVRTAATDKKFASNSGFLKLVLPEASPEIAPEANLTYTVADRENDVDAAFELNFTDLLRKPEGDRYEEYEYALVGSIADGVNLVKQKWTKLPSDGKVDLAKYIGKDYSWFKKDADRATKIKYEAMDAVLIRKAAVKATKTADGVFAGGYSTIDVTVTKQGGTSENQGGTSQNPGDDTEWDLIQAKDYYGVVSFYVDKPNVTENQVVVAKPGTKVYIVVSMLADKYYSEVDTVSAYLYYNIESWKREITVQKDADGYYFTMPEGHVTVYVTEKKKES